MSESSSSEEKNPSDISDLSGDEEDDDENFDNAFDYKKKMKNLFGQVESSSKRKQSKNLKNSETMGKGVVHEHFGSLKSMQKQKEASNRNVRKSKQYLIPAHNNAKLDSQKSMRSSFVSVKESSRSIRRTNK